jgi:DNA-binding NarL/FixJ family response regulator
VIEDFEKANKGPMLTEVEAKLVKMLAAGLSNRQIAFNRNRSLQTIKNQLHIIYGKFGVNTARELLLKVGELREQNQSLFKE